MVNKDYSKSRMRENRTYGSVRGGQSNLIPSTRLTGPLAPRVADCRSAAMLMKSALRIYFSVSYVMITILLTGSLRSPPYPASPDFSMGKRVTRFSGRFASLRIVFPK